MRFRSRGHGRGVPKDYIIAPWVVALQYACENMAEQVGLRSFVSECGESRVSGSLSLLASLASLCASSPADRQLVPRARAQAAEVKPSRALRAASLKGQAARGSTRELAH